MAVQMINLEDVDQFCPCIQVTLRHSSVVIRKRRVSNVLED
ncbi:hypothetical protein SLEP1_g59935 [Rubroshorea leprosula]|uniref:Uncharacterized protein n=1 Tax=Rubroshorea leprosula TaxID=152421 RepID=A0AAV5MUX4_9ROSI|nr:hypothetical protein SLEP1_g59935 [Rubroshorea leprosula]